MAGIRSCKYANCYNTSETRSLFRFPVKHKQRVQIWLQNCGNPKLKKLPLEALGRRYVCEDHFDQCYKNTNKILPRLVMTAIPRHYKGKELNDTESENEEPNDIDGDNNENKCDSVNEEPAVAKYIDVVEICMECDKPIRGFGFQWWCLQCGGLRCGVCALRLAHRSHFLLRSPANTTPEEMQILISAIQKELQLKDLFYALTHDNEKHADIVEDVVTAEPDLEATEEILQEPVVKAEPPDEQEDPLAECSTNSIRKPYGKQKDYQLSIDLQRNPQANIINQIGALEFNENSSDLRMLIIENLDYQPNQKSLDLFNPYEYHRNLQYLGLDKPRKPERKFLSEDMFDCRPSKRSKNKPKSLHNSKFVDFDDYYNNFGLFKFDKPNIDDIRHSSSLQAAPRGPDKAPTPEPKNMEISKTDSVAKNSVPDAEANRMELTESCLLATSRDQNTAQSHTVTVPNRDITCMDSGSCSLATPLNSDPLATDTFSNTDPSMEISGLSFATDKDPSPEATVMEFGYESDGSSMRLDTQSPNDECHSDEELHSTYNKRCDIKTGTTNVENDLMNGIPNTEIRNMTTQTAQVTLIGDETEITEDKPIRTYSENKITQAEIQAHSTLKKESSPNIMKNDHKRNSETTLRKPYDTRNRKDRLQIYNKQDCKKENERHRTHYKSVKNIKNPKNDTNKDKSKRIEGHTYKINANVDKDRKSTDTTEDNQIETQKPLMKVYSKKKRSTNTIEQIDKSNGMNITEDSENNSYKAQESHIQIYSSHKKQSCYNITKLKNDNSVTQDSQIQIYSTHKKRNCTKNSEHSIDHKTHTSIEINITHKEINSDETKDNNKDSNKRQETKLLVYSTHKARKRKYS
ncbi:uncharacterized protein LOC125237387 [Leguminivora glycinivorella]|uniref:uncharacterized protein LOC125237387 n=1 Tax=Leguminivora glycinivorella TaxID=1035111 RepID=UPI00200D4198|nr:uncharacterized protein LOC125237387 [Leguminivora glycinivorella]